MKPWFSFGTLTSFYVKRCSVVLTATWHSKHSCIFAVDDNDCSNAQWMFIQSSYTSWALILYSCLYSVTHFNLLSSPPVLSRLRYLPSDGSDLDTVSHGSLDSANDSAERTSIDTDFTKMDSSDDGFSTGRRQLFLLWTISLSSFNRVTAAPCVTASLWSDLILIWFDLIHRLRSSQATWMTNVNSSSEQSKV